MLKRPFYRHLTSDDAVALTSYPASDHAQHINPFAEGDTACGKPKSKPYIDPVHSFSLLLCLVAFMVGILVILPQTGLPFKLGSTNQMIVLGLLLSVMNYAAKPIISFLFLLLEANSSKPGLQNYDGLLRTSPLASRLSLVWRSSLLLLLGIPLVLSALYKRFLGGTSTQTIGTNPASFGYYGPAGLTSISTIGITFMANATVPFLIAANNDSAPPDVNALPLAYGLNTLLLSTVSAAALDIPDPEHVLSLQGQLEANTYLSLSADVLGLVTTYNDTSTLKDDDSFWTYYYEGGVVPIYTSLYNSFYLAFMNQGVASSDSIKAWDNSWSFLGCTTNDSKTELSGFQQNASLFTTARHSCNGTWRISRQSITLITGACDEEPLNSTYQTLTDIEMALTTYYGSTLAEMLASFCSDRSTSSWLMPTFVVTVASMYWSRLAALLGSNGHLPQSNFYDAPSLGITYNTTETLQLTRSTLRPHWQLILVLAVQPLLAICAYAGTIMLHRTPLRRGFGMVAVLAGIQNESLTLLRGASFSGELKADVTLDSNAGDQHTSHPELSYTLRKA